MEKGTFEPEYLNKAIKESMKLQATFKDLDEAIQKINKQISYLEN